MAANNQNINNEADQLQYALPDPETSDDPQSARAAQGATQSGLLTPQNVRDFVTGENVAKGYQGTTYAPSEAGQAQKQEDESQFYSGLAGAGGQSMAGKTATAAEDAIIGLEHYSPKAGLTEIDPAMMGSGPIRGAEAKRAPTVPRSYMYLEGTKPEDYVAQNAPNPLPVYLKAQNTFDYANPEHIQQLKDALPDWADHIDYIASTKSPSNWTHLEIPEIINAIKSKGFDSVYVRENGVKNTAVFSPNQIRSKFANFDLKKGDKPNISYNKGGLIMRKGYAEGDLVTQEADQSSNGQSIQYPQEQPQTNLVNVKDPDTGEIGSIRAEHLQTAQQQGYTLATPEETQAALTQTKYGTPGQQAIAGAEGAAQASTFGLSTGLETAMGIEPEAIRGRAEANPITHGAGEVAGLIGSSLIPGAGEANILKAAGTAGVGALGMKAVGGKMVQQIGEEAVRGAFETALFQGGEEVSKAFAQDPNQSAETAIADIGISGILGGVFGGAMGAAANKLKAFVPEQSSGQIPTDLLGNAKQRAKNLAKKTLLEMASRAHEEAVRDLALPLFGEDEERLSAAPVESRLAAAMRGGLRSGAEPAPKFVSEVDMPKVNAGEFKASINNSNIIPEAQKPGIIAGLASEKPDADEIRAAGKRLGAQVFEGQVSASPLVQKAEDSLINGVPTYSGIMRRNLYNDGYQKAVGAVNDALGEGSEMSKAELGNNFKQSLVKDIQTQNQPIKQMYDQLKTMSDQIPLPSDAADDLAKELSTIKEVTLSPSSPEGALAKRVISEASNLQTVDDVKAYRAILGRSVAPTAPAGERRMVAIIQDKLGQMEEDAVAAQAKKSMDPAIFSDWSQQKDAAAAVYKPFIDKVKTLSEQLGKGRVYGAQDAINFIQDKLTPEEVTQRLFSKNNSEFLKFFQKNYPDQMEQMKAYQKGILRENASRTGEFQPKLLFNQVNKLQPEIQKSVFNPNELQNIQDAETYIRAIPKNFNPSGTAGMSAMRQFFEHPAGAIIANARDLGIEKFIKAVSASPDVNNAVKLAKSTIRGEKLLTNVTKAVFNKEASIPSNLEVTDKEREKIKKFVLDYVTNPQKMTDLGANNPVPAYTTAFAATAARTVQYLNQLRPNTAGANPLDGRMPANSVQHSQYNRAIDIAQQPLKVLEHIKNGMITPDDIKAVSTMYPSLYKKMITGLNKQMIESVSRGEVVPYKTRIGLSMFTAQPLDTSLTQQGIMLAQPIPKQAPSPQPTTKPKRGTASLSKVSQQYQTADQARSQRMNRPE